MTDFEHYMGIEPMLLSEAVVRRCSVKKLFLKIPQHLQENICARVSFLIKLQASIVRSSRLEVFFKEGFLKNSTKSTGKLLRQSLFFDKVADLRHKCFPVKFLITPFS